MRQRRWTSSFVGRRGIVYSPGIQVIPVNSVNSMSLPGHEVDAQVWNKYSEYSRVWALKFSSAKDHR